MKLMRITAAFMGVLVLIPAARAETRKPGLPHVSFIVEADRLVEADRMDLKLKIEKTGGNYEEAETSLRQVLSRLAAALKKEGLGERDVIIRNLVNREKAGLFSKDYSLTGRVDVRLTAKHRMARIYQVIREADPAFAVEEITYDLSNREALRHELIREASAKLLRQKALYEKIYTLPLKVHSIEEQFASDFRQRESFRGYSFGGKGMISDSEVYSRFPVRRCTVVLRVVLSLGK